ncbi:MAG: hypothetical protein L6Q37_03360 [Bdellovibrionaceae bacterium]|nr:hypothetical protein [Pseudobdellovibrionaceae bacterium]NUM57912.1 hypothetical protein [Pseudobdellovibrionaceae bacterium]
MKKKQSILIDKTSILLVFIPLLFAIWSFYYNGRSLDISCSITTNNTLCSYEVSIFNHIIDSGENEVLYTWKKGRYSFHLYFQNHSISLGYIGNYPPMIIKDRFQIKYQPFSKVILWFTCFLPSLVAIIFSIYYLLKITLQKMKEKKV